MISQPNKTPLRTLDEVMADLPTQRREKIEARVSQTLATLQLSAYRKQQGMSQEQLAKKLRISQSAISQIENQGDINFATLMNYVSALGGKLRVEVDLPDGSHLPLLTS